MYVIKSIGTRLRRARERRKLTQFEVAIALGNSPAYVSNVERGALPTSLASLQNLSRIVGADFGAIREELESHLPSLRAAATRLAREIDEAEGACDAAGTRPSEAVA